MWDGKPDLRRQIIQDILGDSVEEYENFDQEKSWQNENRRQHRQRIPLWRFLLHLLHRDISTRYIEWSSDKVLEFRIKNTLGVAELWGSVKNKTDMTYEKLGRAMRYYYGKNVIEKVPGKRYSYRFILSRRTKKHLSQFIDVSKMQMIKSDSTTDEFNDSGSDTINVDSRPTTPEEVIVDKEETVEIEENQHDRVKPLKPLPNKQTIGKTKIFKPNELMVKTLNQLECNVIPKTRIDLSSPKNRPSAFFIPAKRSKVNDGISYITYTSDQSPNTTTQNKSQILSNLAIRKRVHETEEMKPISITSTIDDTNEIESFYTYDVIPPRANEYKLYSSLTSKSQDEFILRRENRREFIEKHERDIYKLQHQLTLNQRSDPFMGCTYRRIDNEHEKTDSYLRYEGFDEFSTNVACKEKHWVE